MFFLETESCRVVLWIYLFLLHYTRAFFYRCPPKFDIFQRQDVCSSPASSFGLDIPVVLVTVQLKQNNPNSSANSFPERRNKQKLLLVSVTCKNATKKKKRKDNLSSCLLESLKYMSKLVFLSCSVAGWCNNKFFYALTAEQFKQKVLWHHVLLKAPEQLLWIINSP